MTASQAELRRCTPDEFGHYLAVCESAFGRGVTEQEVARWKDVVDPNRLVGAYVDGALVGTAGAYALTVTVPGGTVRAAGVTMVGVLPSHRRRGIFKRLMAELLDDANKRGESVAVLWAAEGGIYSRLGFGLGSKNARIDIESSRAVFREPVEVEGELRLISLAEARAVLPPIYDQVRIETPGMLARSGEWWGAYRLDDAEHERRGGGPMHCCVIAIEGHDDAYALYRLHPRYEHRLHRDWLEVIEAVATTADANRILWNYLLEMDLIERVRADFLPEDHPLLLTLVEPARLRFTLADGLWLRLLDAVAALRARSYLGVGSLVLDIRDPVYEWNSGGVQINIAPGAVEVERSDAQPDIRLDAADLASVYLGAFTFVDLLRAGRIEEFTDGAAMRASLLFQRDRAPWCPEVI